MEKLKSCRLLILYSFIIIVGLLASFTLFYIFSSFDNNALKILPESLSDGKNDLSHRILDYSTPGHAVFRTNIRKTDLERVGEGNYAILVDRLNCQAFSIYFNDIFLGSVGDMTDACSSIRNSVNCFYIDKAALLRYNELRLEICSLYDTGLSSTPIYVVDSADLNRYLGRAEFFTGGINLISIGLTTFSSIIVFILFLISRPRKASYLFFSLSLLAISIFTWDYTSFYNLPFSYITYKKLIFLALYLSIAAASMGIYELFHNKTDRIMAIVTLSGMLLIELFSKDMAAFKTSCDYYSVMIGANALSWMYTTYKNFKKSEEAKMLFIADVVLILSLAYEAYVKMSGGPMSFRTPFIYTFIASTVAIVLLFSEITNKENQLRSVRLKHNSIYKTSITDGMTGLYNHAYMVNMLHRAVAPYSVVMLDIDDFKEINDSFGHRFGDIAICHVAANLKKHVRSNDLVFRYGGDEFFIILYECTDEKAMEIVLTINRHIIAECPTCNEKPITVTLSGGIYYVEREELLESIFDKVDSALYDAKNKGKNNISIYNEAKDIPYLL